jgi:hypothetical protein
MLSRRLKIHLASGTMLPLYHDVLPEDLDHSDALRKISFNNASTRRQDLPKVQLQDLLMIYPEEPHPSNLLRRDRFNAWRFLHGLVYFGSESFHQFRKDLGEREAVDCIPAVKTSQIPNRALDTSPNAPAENAEPSSIFKTSWCRRSHR